MPRQPVPALRVPALDGPVWDIAERRPERCLPLVFYRGLHCPVCHACLAELNRLLRDIARRGIKVFALSVAPRERAEEARHAWHLDAEPRLWPADRGGAELAPLCLRQPRPQHLRRSGAGAVQRARRLRHPPGTLIFDRCIAAVPR